jgi:hypothetical protein
MPGIAHAIDRTASDGANRLLRAFGTRESARFRDSIRGRRHIFDQNRPGPRPLVFPAGAHTADPFAQAALRRPRYRCTTGAQHRTAKANGKAQRSLVRSLTHNYNVPGPLPAVARVVERLARSGVFRLRGVLVGTVACQTYAAMLGARPPGALMQKSDVDEAQFLSVSIAVQDNTESMDSVLQGIDPSFTRIPNLAQRLDALCFKSKVAC